MLIGDNPYRCIGKDFCGSVRSAEEDKNTHAIKREDRGSGRSITNNYNMHLRIIHSMNQYPAYMPLAIPRLANGSPHRDLRICNISMSPNPI
jgi:hypothetical protein